MGGQDREKLQDDARIPAASEVVAPGPGASFETPGASEKIACIASEVELGLALPEALKTEDLMPPAGVVTGHSTVSSTRDDATRVSLKPPNISSMRSANSAAMGSKSPVIRAGGRSRVTSRLVP